MTILAKAVGRRKEAVAQVQIKLGTGQFIINNKPAQEYLQNDFYSLLSVKAPFDITIFSSIPEGKESLTANVIPEVSKNKGTEQNTMAQVSSSLSIDILKQTANVSTDLSLTDKNKAILKFDTIVKVKGGGLMGQAEAIRLGVSRAICLLATPGAKPSLSSAGGQPLVFSKKTSFMDVDKHLKNLNETSMAQALLPSGMLPSVFNLGENEGFKHEVQVKNNEVETTASSGDINLVDITTGEVLPILNTLDIRKQLKDKGYLTQDSRVKERRKYGLKKARKASQYHKR